MRRRRALIGVAVPHLVIFPQQHVAAEARGLIARCLRGVAGIGDDHLAQQVAAIDLGKRVVTLTWSGAGAGVAQPAAQDVMASTAHAPLRTFMSTFL
jgi:hypothetical protein